MLVILHYTGSDSFITKFIQIQEYMQYIVGFTRNKNSTLFLCGKLCGKCHISTLHKKITFSSVSNFI